MCRRYFGCKKLIHTMPLNVDQPINRATVVGCAISATRNYLKSHGPTKLNPHFCNTRAKTPKLCIPSSPNAPFEKLPGTQTTCGEIPIAPAALSVPYLPRLRALALFGRRPSERGDSLGMPASENLHTSRLKRRCERRRSMKVESGHRGCSVVKAG
jgi:hypothetical protein